MSSVTTVLINSVDDFNQSLISIGSTDDYRLVLNIKVTKRKLNFGWTVESVRLIHLSNKFTRLSMTSTFGNYLWLERLSFALSDEFIKLSFIEVTRPMVVKSLLQFGYLIG
ncbi:MAG: hypothetical protein ACTS4X_00335 [Candidatus Hodgkinia cicadicola]